MRPVVFSHWGIVDFAQFFLGGLPAWSLLIIAPLLFAAGFVDAVGGGGGLVSLPAYILCGLPSHAAIATNKMSSTMGTTIATLKYARRGYMDLKFCIPSVVLAICGSFLGSNLALLASDQLLIIVMLVALPIVGGYVLFKKDISPKTPAFPFGKTVALCMLIAFTIGIYDGFYGPGTGTFLMLLLMGVARLDVFKTAGVTKSINLTTNVTSLAVFLVNGEVLIGLGLLAGLFNIAGNYLGATYFSNKGVGIVRPIVLVVIAIFFVRLVLQLLGIF
ncbi:MAG: TSUP family transporter [Eggerthellaceae bacterium]|nr:TSUP family transporter [Eggerthellaceae bacterium]